MTPGALEVSPQLLNRIEIRTVRRQEHQGATRFFDELTGATRLMKRGIVQRRGLTKMLRANSPATLAWRTPK